MSESGRVVRLAARGTGFDEAWAGRGVAVQGTAARDGDLAVLVRFGSNSVPGMLVPEVVGRCQNGVFCPVYRTRGLP